VGLLGRLWAKKVWRTTAKGRGGGETPPLPYLRSRHSSSHALKYAQPSPPANPKGVYNPQMAGRTQNLFLDGKTAGKDPHNASIFIKVLVVSSRGTI
jgi:hypothetical protein